MEEDPNFLWKILFMGSPFAVPIIAIVYVGVRKVRCLSKGSFEAK